MGPKLGSRMMGCIGKWIGYYIFLVKFEKVQYCLKMLHKCVWGQVLCHESNKILDIWRNQAKLDVLSGVKCFGINCFCNVQNFKLLLM